MTDKEIIKALECCNGEYGACVHCSLWEKDSSECMKILFKKTLNLISHQKAEIERYKGVIRILERDVRMATTEATKSFVEKIKGYIAEEWVMSDDTYAETVDEIDNLVKEVTEGKDNGEV